MVKTIQTKGGIFALKLMFIMFTLSLFIEGTNAQSRDRKWNVGLMGGISVYAGDLGNSMTNFTSEVFTQNLDGGITFSRYINKSFDVSLFGAYGSWGYYKDNVTIFKGTIMHGNLNLKYKFNNGYLIAENAKLAPYFFAGYGYSQFTGGTINNGEDYPIIGGLGLRFRMNDVLSLNYQATYGYMQTAHNNPDAIPYVKPSGYDQIMFHMVGLGFNLGSGKDEDKDGVNDSRDKCPNTPKGIKVDGNGCPFDKDLDGVLDFEDDCPNMAGTLATKGCPDTDKDGVADKDDQCINEFGLISLNGCPDSDGDGIVNSKDKCPNVFGVLAFEGCPDTDGDGIKDDEDNCPKVKGTLALKGCPDSDGDGIEDSKDACPTTKGLLIMNGCPDTDNDGTHDGIDKCPNLAGDKTHSGCPDTDGDGVYDDIDRCINIAGKSSNMGCPELKKETQVLFQKALQGIQFETGKAIIKPVSFPILNSIAKVMSDNPEYKLNIGGHTDDVGEDAMNLTLSEDRASAVAKYLIGKGTDPMRISSQGFGETVPVDTNSSVKGRTRNRRVEFNVEFLDIAK